MTLDTSKPVSLHRPYFQVRYTTAEKVFMCVRGLPCVACNLRHNCLCVEKELTWDDRKQIMRYLKEQIAGPEWSEKLAKALRERGII
jgi:hypothetical protein